MTLQQIQDDYVNERKVLETWLTRIGGSIPPEGGMSQEYKDGWKKYLGFVMQISDRMIGICNQGNVKLLKDTLDDEVKKYNALADQATSNGLIELGNMLRWEATSRVEIMDDLS